jgi:hypothetical protein
MQQKEHGRGRQSTEKRPAKHSLHNGVTKRLQFQFPEAAIHTLRDLAVRTGQPTIAGVLRDSLKVYTWIVTEQEQGRSIFSADRQTRRRREILPLLQMPPRSGEQD